MNGAPWPLGAAPICVMAPDNGADDGWGVDAFVEYHVLNLGANAIHRPLQGNYPNSNDHRLLQLAEEHGFLVLFFMYGDEQSGTAPSDALGHHARYHFDVVEALLPFSHNFAMGLGYDLREWVDDSETNRWVRRLKEQFPQIMFGCRVRLDEVRRDPLDFSKQRLAYRAGDYASFEHQLIDKTDYRFEDMLASAHAPVLPLGEPVHRPLLNEERFRVGPREKDFPTASSLAPAIAAHKAANIGCVVGMRDAGPNWRWPSGAEDILRAAFTGSIGEPESLLPTVERERAKFGTPLTNPQMGIILNNVCLQHPGWGMAKDDTGLVTTQPITGISISRDKIIHRPTGFMYDVFVDVAGAATPAWNRVHEPPPPFVEPVSDSSVTFPGHVPVYSTPYAAVGGVTMLLRATGAVALFDSGTVRNLPFGDTASPRLHPSGHIYYVAGAELRREHIRGGGGSERVQLFESRVTIGGNEGDFDPSFRYLPILRNEHVGIYDVETGGYVEAHAGPGIDWAMVGDRDTLAVGRVIDEDESEIQSYVRINGVLRRRSNLAPASGHSDVAMLDGVPHLVTTTSAWTSGWPRGNGGEEWLVAIDMLLGTVIPIRETHWRAYHIACWQDWICVSFYTPGIPPQFPAGEIWLGKISGEGQVIAIAEGAAPEPYTAQPHAAWSADGRRIYYGESGNTVVVDVSSITQGDEPIDPVDPPPPPTEDRMIIDINDLQTFRVAATPHPDHDHKWGSSRHWPTEVPEITVAKINETDDTFICYGIGYFIGMEAAKQDEITAEARVRAKDEGAGRLLPLKVEEKDSPGMAFDSTDFYALPKEIRINPGDEMSGLFQHHNTGTKTDEGQTPVTANAPHAHITFYCYRA